MPETARRSAKAAVTAEWALWGKTSNDRGYRLLDYSRGRLGPGDFNEVLTRYSPGTLESLPQVTVSWLSQRDERNYLAIAIHEMSEQGLCDADGRTIVFTRYFCVPYDDLSAGDISYLAMYEELGKLELPRPDRHLINVELAREPASMPRGGPALRVAALLLTCKPVCIIGADRTGLLDRLQFLDTVASLLPYGMRCRLSASTWASSTLQTHKFRLFFASAPRPVRDHQPTDHVVEWGRHYTEPIGHAYADDYLTWLEDELQRPAGQLAAQKQQIDFNLPDVLKMLERVGVPSGSAGLPSYSYGTDLVVAQQWSATGPMRAMNDEELITSCASSLAGPNPELIKLDIKPWRDRLGRSRTADERAHNRQLIKKHRLLREDLPVDAALRSEIYDVLLHLAFSVPFTYVSYCEVEACAGGPTGKPLHQSVREAMARAGPAELAAYVLVESPVMDKGLIKRLAKAGVDPIQLISVVAASELHPAHSSILCKIAAQFLRERGSHVDRHALHSALNRHGYLAPVLDQRHPDDVEFQLSMLTEFVRAVHGDRLNESAATDVLENNRHAPTAALLATVLRMVNPAEVAQVSLKFVREYLVKTAFDEETHKQLMHLFAPIEQHEAVPGMAVALRSDHDSAAEKRSPFDWIRDYRQSKG